MPTAPTTTFSALFKEVYGEKLVELFTSGVSRLDRGYVDPEKIRNEEFNDKLLQELD